MAFSPATASAAQERIVYIKDFELFRATDWGGLPQQLTWLSAGNPRAYHASQSHDGQYVVFTDGPSFGRLHVLNISQNFIRTLYTNPGGTAPAHRPKFSPDGKKIIFHTGNAGSGDIQIINLDGTGLTKVIPWKDHQADADFSPDGQQIVFGSLSDSRGRRLLNSENQLFVANVNGTSPVQITRTGTGHRGAHTPDWGPNGEIAFAGVVPYSSGTTSSQQGDIFTISSNGTAQRQLMSNNHHRDWDATWSKSGDTISFSTDREGPAGYYDIYWIPASGGTATPLIPAVPPNSVDSPSYRQTNPNYDQWDYAATEHRPIIYFDEEDPWRPLDIPKFFAEGNHLVCNAGGVGCTAANTTSLKNYTSPDAYIRVAGGPGEGDYGSPDPLCNTSELNDCNEGDRSTIYYNVSLPSPLGYRYIDYWWFYRFNNVTDNFGDHVGDWEGMSIAPSNDDPRTFHFASFAQHTGWFSYLRDNLSCDGVQSEGSCGTRDNKYGTRPHVYPANGSHASYPDTCENGFEVCTHSNSPVPEFDHGGEDAWGNNWNPRQLHEFPATAPIGVPWASGPREWVDWPGNWGHSGTNGEDSPESPGTQDRFKYPWDSDCATSECEPETPPEPSPKLAPRAKVAIQRARTVRACGGWFGARVAAVACDASDLRTALERRRLGKKGQFRLEVKGRRADHAPGIAQAVGEPLKPGQRLVVRGKGSSRTQLLVRVRSGKRVYDVAFPSVELGQRSGAAVVKVQAPGLRKAGAGRPQVVLFQPDGTRVPAAAMRVSATLR